MTLETKFKIGDKVPYTNTAGKIVWCKIINFKETGAKNKIWYEGENLITGAPVWYPENTSHALLQSMNEYAISILQDIIDNDLETVYDIYGEGMKGICDPEITEKIDNLKSLLK